MNDYLSSAEIEELFKDGLLKTMLNLKGLCKEGKIPVKKETVVNSVLGLGDKLIPISTDAIAFYFINPDTPRPGYLIVDKNTFSWSELLAFMPGSKKVINSDKLSPPDAIVDKFYWNELLPYMPGRK